MLDSRICLGDCRDLFKDLPDESIDLVLSDVPYKVISGGDAKGIWRDKMMGGCMAKHSTNFVGDEESYNLVRQGKIFAHNDIEFKEFLPDVWRVLKMDSHCYLMVNGRNLKDLWQAAEDAGFVYQQLLVWNKGTATPNRYYMNACEYILMLRKGQAVSINDMGMWNVLNVPNVPAEKKHPTGKPVGLMEILIRQSSEPDDIVLDPFMGSGSTCLAAKNLNRRYIGFEIDPKYYGIAEQRLAEKSTVSLFESF